MLVTPPPTPLPSSFPRAVSQNKELKLNLAELQDAFVRLSQQNMELASELETERHRVGELQRLVKETSSMKEEEKEEEERVKPTLTARDDEDRIGNEERIESEHLQVGWSMYQGCVEHVPGMCGACTRDVWSMYQGCVEHVPGMCGACTRDVWSMYQGCVEHVPGMCEG